MLKCVLFIYIYIYCRLILLLLFLQNNIACTAHSSAMYLQRIGFQDKIYMIGNRAMAAELDACGISYTGLGVSMK